MGQLTIEAERRMLVWALSDPFDVTVPFTMPIMVRLMTTNGDAADAGTEITGDSYEPLDVPFAQTASTDGVEFVNTTSLDFPSLDSTGSVTVAGLELWDSSSTPVRMAVGELDSPETVTAGSPYSIAAGEVKVRLA